MFSTVNHFQMFKPGSVNDRSRPKTDQNRAALNCPKRPRLEMAKEDTVHVKKKKCKATK